MVILNLSLAGAAAEPTLKESGPGRSREPVSEDVVVLPKAVPDPLEPFNRVMWAVNRELLRDLVKPTGKVYRFLVPAPVRRGIRQFSRNLGYPVRLANHLLQGRWKGADDETQRFLSNTLLGGGGFVDVSGRWGVGRSEADFGQTLGRWGWDPACYLMLPLLGPANERDLLGRVADNAAHPLTYLKPYPSTLSRPLSMVSPYGYFSSAATYNSLTESVEGAVRTAWAEADAYSLVRYAWTFAREVREPDLSVHGERDPASLQTLQSVFVSFKDPVFPERGRTWQVRIPETGRRLKYTSWIQPRRAPIVYLVPGLGSHRLADTVLALAELVWRRGYSVVSVSSPYHPEFMESAATAAMPGYTPVDVGDLHRALTRMDAALEERFPGRLADRAVMGYSMGGFQAALMAAAPPEPGRRRFDRCVAIDTPVRLTHGMAQLDAFYNAPLAWVAAERTDRIENTFLKIAASAQGGFKPQSPVPFDGVESRFLIGLNFRFILRDIIHSSQRRHPQGVLQQPFRPLRRSALHEEILRYSYAAYLREFVTPYYAARGIDLTAPETLERAGDLKLQGSALRSHPHLRVVVNANDFLLGPGDLEWLRSTLGPGQLTVFEDGGHLGNLGDPGVQAALIRALDGDR